MKELTCIVCPRGCRLTVDEDNGYSVTGYSCEKGLNYGKQELINPVRMLTSIVRIEGAIHNYCPVKTAGDIPKALIHDAMELLKPVTLKSPVKTGDVVVKDICGTGVDWIVTKTL